MTNWHERILDWPLTPESVVVEVGGYEGAWAKEIAWRYDPYLYVFEPQKWAYDVALKRFGEQRLTRAMFFNYGLGERELADAPMGRWRTDGASFVNVSAGDHETGRLRPAQRVFAELGLERIDLLSINVEGYEYPLLAHLLETGWLARTRFLLVQWHAAGELVLERPHLEQRIAETHRELYSGPHTAWERRQ